MNNERIKILTNIYIRRWEELTTKEQDERDRWVAAGVCSRTWDQDAEDFSAMFDAAMEQVSGYLRLGDSDPAKGIRTLLSKGYEEEVRRSFEQLLNTDQGDIEVRFDHILDFVRNMNTLLESEAPGRWELRQKIDAAIGYLAFIRPNENFLFKASETAAFAGYAEIEEEIGYDKRLRLLNYYRSASELADYLLTREDLMGVISEGLSIKEEESGAPELLNVDRRGHLLAYSLIHCAYAYGFYEDKMANRKSRISTVQQRRIDRMKQQAKLLDEREKLQDALEEAQAKEKMAVVPQLQGLDVQHKAFGNGVITSHEGRYLTVEFSNITKKFALPGVVVNGYLSFTDAKKVVEACAALDAVSKERQKRADALNSIDVQLKMLE